MEHKEPGYFSIGYVHFVNKVLVMIMEMGSTIACNGARPNVNNCVNSLMVL